MKKIIISIILVLLILPTSVFAKASDLTLSINGIAVSQGNSPVIINNSTYIPLRNLFENIDFTVVYYPEYKSALALYNKGDFKLSFTINSDKVEITTVFLESTSKTVIISGKPIFINGSVYVPMRAFSELLGANVNYDKYSHTVYFNSSVEKIKNKIYPLVGLPLTEVENIQTPVVDTNKSLTAKEIAKLIDRVGYVETYDSNGKGIGSASGFMINNGFFITNRHVIDNVAEIFVKIDGEIYDASNWTYFDNPTVDVYALPLSSSFTADGMPNGKSPTKFLEYSITLPEIGDIVYAIGSPDGLENTVSQGIVSGIRNINGITYIQHTCDTEPGSSGGVLLNDKGVAVGITNMGKNNTTLDFAIPMSYVQTEINKLNSK